MAWGGTRDSLRSPVWVGAQAAEPGPVMQSQRQVWVGSTGEMAYGLCFSFFFSLIIFFLKI